MFTPASASRRATSARRPHRFSRNTVICSTFIWALPVPHLDGRRAHKEARTVDGARPRRRSRIVDGSHIMCRRAAPKACATNSRRGASWRETMRTGPPAAKRARAGAESLEPPREPARRRAAGAAASRPPQAPCVLTSSPRGVEGWRKASSRTRPSPPAGGWPVLPRAGLRRRPSDLAHPRATVITCARRLCLRPDTPRSGSGRASSADAQSGSSAFACGVERFGAEDQVGERRRRPAAPRNRRPN
jgi:hypothetical protein